MPTDILDALEAAHREATPGEWIFDDGEGYGTATVWGGCAPSGYGKPGRMVAQIIGDDAEVEPNGQFISLAHNHLSALLDVARKAREITDAYYAPGSRLRIPVNLAEDLRAALAALAALESPTK